MNRYYHGRFFSDIRTSTLLILSLFVAGWALAPEAFLLVPVVALLGANQTAFDASYLIFSRHYSTILEEEINSSMRRQVLVASEMEERYFFPLDTRKVVVAGLGRDFSWFAWMTILYTLIGAASFVAGIGLGWQTLVAAGSAWVVFYSVTVGVLTLASLVVGWWWFVIGEGEQRLTRVTSARFGSPTTAARSDRKIEDVA